MLNRLRTPLINTVVSSNDIERKEMDRKQETKKGGLKRKPKSTLFSLKHGQLRIRQWAAGNVDSVKVYKRDFLVNKAKEEQRRLHYRLVLM